MEIASDWHIHSRNSCDDACMEVAELVRLAPEKGIRDFALTDHIHTPYNLPDIVRSREEFLSCKPSPNFHFGIEVSCVSEWEIAEVATGKHANPVYGLRRGGPPGGALAISLSQEEIAGFGIELVVGGTHWPMYVPMERDAIIRDYHRQNMFLALHPLVTIIAHPWWWHGHWADAKRMFPCEPWFDDFAAIPESMHDEFAAAAMAEDKVVEINISAMLVNPAYPQRFVGQYLEYLAGLKERGVRLCVGSDCHSAHYEIDFPAAAAMLDRVGITEEDLWRLPPREEREDET